MTKCLKCGKEILDKGEFCGYCGEKIKEANLGEETISQVSKTVNSKDTSKRKKILGIISLTVVAIIITIIILVMNNPVQEFKKAFNGGDFIKASEIYKGKIQKDVEKKQAVTEDILITLDDTMKKYIDEKISYEKAMEQLKAIKDMGWVVSQANLIEKEIEMINKSRIKYQKGLNFLEERNYLEAITSFKQVIDIDKNYNDAQNKIGELKSEYKQDVSLKAKEYSIKEQYEEAIKILNQGLEILVKDDELTANKQFYEKKLAEQKEIELKRKMENAKQEQIIIVKSAKIVIQDDKYKALYPDMLQAIIQNNSQETIKNMKVGFIGFDKNGFPVKIKSQYDFSGGAYEMIGNAQDVNVIPGATFGNNVGWNLDENHGIKYLLGCVKEAEFYNGETWNNDYYDYWRDYYIEKPLPDEMKK